MTGPKAIIRHEQWTLTPDREPDAPPLKYKMECAVCGDGSEESEGWNDPQAWTLEHSGKNPSHHSFREVITRPWRTFMHNP
ncbi:hypothetical protein SEA_ISSMI_50 [Streptomyces phage Issmi]|uniref:DUF7848 domain-containing protein n=1 Tax=Streptomyces phage Issmi TaxID=2725628 RepID=A0A6M3SXG9_9CAUD|nr:hypothetical protein KGG87_gp50 [Streptomyces phage Issmi]QJD50696.1 hypothetical protein SEA_ISSMI_50 [Streptomyces phage Issmi]